MLTVETIKRVRLALVNGESQRYVSRKYRMSRKTVKKIASGNETEFKYSEREVKYPVLGAYIERLNEILEKEEALPRKARRTGRKVFEVLQLEGYAGGYDSVRRYISKWRTKRDHVKEAYVPLEFAKGEAFQFDWSRETVEIGGVVQDVEVAQIRLCHSRMPFCMAFFRQEMAMLMEAHVRAHDFFGGLCERGIYDNLKAVVDNIGRGKARDYNNRFMQMASHYLFEPCACTPKAGWEKGQVENQVGTNRMRVFVPRLKFGSMRELNEHLQEEMLAEAHTLKHPEFADKSVFEVYLEERPFLRQAPKAFSGYTSEERRAGLQCLVRFDGNNYSLPCEHAGKAVSIRIFAERIVIAAEGYAVAEHERSFGKGAYILEPLHYLPLLERKPGALRNGRPFINWELPEPIRRVWDILSGKPGWDGQMSRLLLTIPSYGIDALAVACETALEEGVVSEGVILNYLTRLSDEPPAKEAPIPEKLKLIEEPRSNCELYDDLLENLPCCAKAS